MIVIVKQVLAVLLILCATEPLGIVESTDGELSVSATRGSATRWDTDRYTYLNVAMFEPDFRREHNERALAIVLRFDRANSTASRGIDGTIHLLGVHDCELKGLVESSASHVDISGNQIIEIEFNATVSQCYAESNEPTNVSVRLSNIPLTEDPNLIVNLRGAIDQAPEYYQYILDWREDIR